MTPNRRRRSALTRVFAFATVAVCSVTLRAHHSSAMYDQQRTVSLHGVVTQFRWTNPHVSMTIKTDARGGHDGELWIVEATSPGNLSREGWTRTSVRVDDRVEVVAAPLRDGGHGGYCRSVTLTNTRARLEC
jgi:hypothetical protein